MKTKITTNYLSMSYLLKGKNDVTVQYLIQRVEINICNGKMNYNKNLVCIISNINKKQRFND